MPDPHTLGVFALAALALLLVPGPAVLYVVAQSVGSGSVYIGLGTLTAIAKRG